MQITEVEATVGEEDVDKSLQTIEKVVTQIEKEAPNLDPLAVKNLRAAVTEIGSRLTEEQKLALWKLSYRIWNTCVEISNDRKDGFREQEEETHARLRHISCDILLLAGEVAKNIKSGLLKTAYFFFKTGTIWAENALNLELAEVAFSKATELCIKYGDENRNHLQPEEAKEQQQLAFNIYTSRARTASELSQRALALNLLGRAKTALHALPERLLDLAAAYFEIGKSVLATVNENTSAEAIPYFQQAQELCGSAGDDQAHNESGQSGSVPELYPKVLRYLAASHIATGSKEGYESALQTISVLQNISNHASTSFLSLKALCGLERLDEAETELTSLIGHPGASAEVCLNAIEMILQCKRVTAAQSAYKQLLKRFPSDTQLPVRIVEKLLATSVDDNLEVALDICADVAEAAELAHEHGKPVDAKAMSALHALLWNRGASIFSSKKDYKTSLSLFESALLFLSPDNKNRGKSMRVLALCHMGLQEFDRALEYLTQADKTEPGISASAVLQFKIAVQQKDERRAAEIVEKIKSCRDFEADYLKLLSHEATFCGYTSVAVSALSHLLTLSLEKKAVQEKEAILLRNLIKLTGDESPGDFSKTIQHYEKARDRLQALGKEAFFGGGTVGDKEVKWFAGSAWNSGLQAAKTGDWPLCARLFACTSAFYEQLPDPSLEDLEAVKLSHLLGATASLQASESVSAEEVKSVEAELEKCKLVLTDISKRTDSSSSADDGTELQYNLLSFTLKGRQKNYKAQIDILAHIQSVPGATAQHLSQMGLQAADTPGAESLDVAMAALRASLQMIMRAQVPDYALASAINRKVINLADLKCKDGPEVFATYKEVTQLLVGLSAGQYPKDEVSWLVSTAWNRAAFHVRFSHSAEAEKWMRVALNLLQHAPQMENKRQMMMSALDDLLSKRKADIEE